MTWISRTVIDTGTDTKHPDIQNNLWVNSAEIAGNGVDDDSNGFVDDVHGESEMLFENVIKDAVVKRDGR